MAKEKAIDEAALSGFIGVVFLFVGSSVASFLLEILPRWFALVPALLVLGASTYLGMQQFADAVYTVVEDVQT